MNHTTLLSRPTVPLHEIASQSERNQRAAREATQRAEMERAFAERKLVEPSLLRLCELAAKHAADRAFLLGRAAAYQARGDTDVSDVIGQSDAAGRRLADVERQIKELQR